LFLAQGSPFIQAGQEFLRSKDGEPNSYNLSDAVNNLRWAERVTQATTVNYYKGLIAIRKAHKAFRMSTPAEISANVKFLNAPSDVLAYSINGKAVGDSWKTIVVVANPNKSSKKVTLPATGNWNVTVQGSTAGTKTLTTLRNTKSVTVAGNSTMVLYK
jgi:pullulanase